MMRVIAALAVAAVLQSDRPVPVDLVKEVAALTSGATNDARLDALTALLRARQIPFETETFSIAKQVGNEPRTEGRNVVARFGSGSEHLLIGAHYDAARLPDGSLSRGAVDNAASSIILVRIAESLRAAPPPLRVTIAWFDMEELGLRGSAAFAERHAADNVTAMLNLDINAYGDTVLFGPSAGTTNAALRRRLLATCADQSIDCVAFPQMPPGDDQTFTRRRIPTLSLAILPAVEVHQLWLMLNAGQKSGLAKETVPSVLQTIHTAEDTIAKVDGESMGRVLRLVMALVGRGLDGP
jgi:Zn-dependent M28 family amino/carboxypeptidase